MSQLQIFAASDSRQPLPHFASNDPALITSELAQRGIGFERWPARAELPAGAGPEQVLAYLARYTHRIAISNSRITAFDGQRVTFKVKDYRKANPGCTADDVAEYVSRLERTLAR